VVVAALLSGLLGVACAPSLSTFQPAHVAPKGHVMASAAIEGGVSVGGVESLVSAGKAVARRGQEQGTLTPDETWQVLDAGVDVLLASASIGYRFAAAYTPVERLEVGIGYAGLAWRLGARYQFLSHATGPFDLTAGLGVARFSYEFPLSDQIPGLSLDDFTRWQIDVPVALGTSRDWFRVWVGPKILLTSFETQLTLSLPNQPATVARFEGQGAFLGGQGGVALGYRWLFLAVELTLAEAFGTAHVTAVGLDPPTHDTKLSGLTVFPTVGLIGEI
jgi:hypothetical protein